MTVSAGCCSTSTTRCCRATRTSSRTSCKAWAATLRAARASRCASSRTTGTSACTHVADELGFALVRQGGQAAAVRVPAGPARLGTARGRDGGRRRPAVHRRSGREPARDADASSSQPLSSTDLPHTLLLRSSEALRAQRARARWRDGDAGRSHRKAATVDAHDRRHDAARRRHRLAARPHAVAGDAQRRVRGAWASTGSTCRCPSATGATLVNASSPAVRVLPVRRLQRHDAVQAGRCSNCATRSRRRRSSRARSTRCTASTAGSSATTPTAAACSSRCASEAGFEPEGKRVVDPRRGRSGGRGARRRSCSSAPRTSTVVGRGVERAEDLIERIGGTRASTELVAVALDEDAREAVEAADLVVNATPVGMSPGDELPVPRRWLRPGQVVADMVYRPAVTPLHARRRGARRRRRRRSRACSSRRARSRSTSGTQDRATRAPRDVMRAAAEAELARRPRRRRRRAMMAAASGKRLGKMLVQAGVITDEQLEEALAEADGALARRSARRRRASRPRTSDRAGGRRADGPGLRRPRRVRDRPERGDAARIRPRAPLQRAADRVPGRRARRRDGGPRQHLRHRRPAHRHRLRDPAGRRRRERPARRDRASSRRCRQNVDEMVGDLEDSLARRQRRTSRGGRAGEESAGRQAHEPDHHRGASGRAPATSTSSRRRTSCASGTASTACARRSCAARRSCTGSSSAALKISSGMDIAEKRDPAGRAVRRRARRQGGRLPRRGPADRAAARCRVIRLLRRDSIMMSLEDLGFLEQPLQRLMDALDEAVRLHPRHRPDRLGQVDDAVRGDQRDERPEDEPHHRRGPGRVPARGSVAGAGARAGGPDVRRGAALDPAPGPRQGHDR